MDPASHQGPAAGHRGGEPCPAAVLATLLLVWNTSFFFLNHDWCNLTTTIPFTLTCFQVRDGQHTHAMMALQVYRIPHNTIITGQQYCDSLTASATLLVSPVSCYFAATSFPLDVQPFRLYLPHQGVGLGCCIHRFAAVSLEGAVLGEGSNEPRGDKTGKNSTRYNLAV